MSSLCASVAYSVKIGIKKILDVRIKHRNTHTTLRTVSCPSYEPESLGLPESRCPRNVCWMKLRSIYTVPLISPMENMRVTCLVMQPGGGRRGHTLPMWNPHLPLGHDGAIFQCVSKDMAYTSYKPRHVAQTKLTNETHASSGLGCTQGLSLFDKESLK